MLVFVKCMMLAVELVEFGIPSRFPVIGEFINGKHILSKSRMFIMFIVLRYSTHSRPQLRAELRWWDTSKGSTRQWIGVQGKNCWKVLSTFFWCSKRSFCTLVIKRGNGKSMNIHRLEMIFPLKPPLMGDVYGFFSHIWWHQNSGKFKGKKSGRSWTFGRSRFWLGCHAELVWWCELCPV